MQLTVRITILAAILTVFGCAPDSYEFCFRLHYHDPFYAEQKSDCAVAGEAEDDLEQVVAVAREAQLDHGALPTATRETLAACRAFYAHAEILTDPEGDVGEGWSDLVVCSAHVANDGNERGVLRHEFFHIALWRLLGNPDYDHSSPRWDEVN